MILNDSAGHAEGLDQPEFGASTSSLICLAMQNDAEAQNCLGLALLFGKDVVPDAAAAYQWFKSAAEHGSVRAFSNLAYMYMEGIYVETNPHVARVLLEEAVNRGCPHAENNLGVLLASGRLEESDITLAKVSFAIAASHGIQAGIANLISIT